MRTTRILLLPILLLPAYLIVTGHRPSIGGLLRILFPPKFIPHRDMPDLSGKTVLVTGGNTGIGYETVKQLLLKNAKVYLTARSATKAASAIELLKLQTQRTAKFILLDLADLRSVRGAAEAFLNQESRLDILFNNAGVMVPPSDLLTVQKHDLQFGTNAIGHFFLTELLVPALRTSQEATNIPARVIHISSSGHQLAPAPGIDFVSLKGGPQRDAWINTAGTFHASWQLYGQSKLANILISNYFANAYSDILVSCAVNPGGISTELRRHTDGLAQRIKSLLLFPAEMGAYTPLWGATVATRAQMNGQYLVPWGKVGTADNRASNKTLEKKVVAYVKEQTKGF